MKTSRKKNQILDEMLELTNLKVTWCTLGLVGRGCQQAVELGSPDYQCQLPVIMSSWHPFLLSKVQCNINVPQSLLESSS